MTAATDTPVADYTLGLALIAKLARTGRPFSSNDCRRELRDLGFSRYTTGRLWQLAETDGLIRQVGLERSSDRATRSRVVRWIGADHRTPLEALIPRNREVLAVPAHRDRDGRFTSGQQYTDVPLFDVPTEGRPT